MTRRLIITAVSLLAVTTSLVVLSDSATRPGLTPTPTPSLTPAPSATTSVTQSISSNNFSFTDDQATYNGQNGVDALTLLKQFTSVEQDNSGLVVAIDNKKADSSKHQYWAFYINGKLSDVGPSDYKTRDGDKILWKIESY